VSDATLRQSLIEGHPKWTFLLGFDFGFQDDSAFVVAAYGPHDTTMYIVKTLKKPDMIAEDVAAQIKELRKTYDFRHMVGDCANLQFVQTLRQTYKLPLIAADKRGKEAHIAALNSDLRTGKVRLLRGLNDALWEEWQSLTWDEKKRVRGEFKEAASKANHAADASLYVHHFSRHYRATPEPEPDIRSKMRRAAEDSVRKANEGMAPPDDDVDDFYKKYGT
jgi:hypothetical protein